VTAATRTLIRHSQLRRTEPVDYGTLDDEYFSRGRYFAADCLPTDTNGQFVYITGPAVGGWPQVTKVDISTNGMYPAVGVLIEKDTPTRCMVHVIGEFAVSPANLIPGKPYFIGADSMLTHIPPVALVGGFVAVQAVGTAIDYGRLLLSVHPQLFLRSG
jgi:hypothetical protein